MVYLTTAVTLSVVCAHGQNLDRYRELKGIVNNHTGFAHGMRGMNMYTLVALRECITEKANPVLAEMLNDKDRITRMTAANVLADLRREGRDILSARLRKTITQAVAPKYRSILQHPLTERERLKFAVAAVSRIKKTGTIADQPAAPLGRSAELFNPSSKRGS